MIDQKKLKLLIQLMIDNDLTELDLEDQGEKVKLKRGSGQPPMPYMAAPPITSPPTGTATSPPVAPFQTNESSQEQSLVAITSPMVGTFYASPTPDAQPFVAIGDPVNAGQVVCIIEAMKVFNEIKAEANGTIARIEVETGQAVEFGQGLFMVKAN